MRLPWLLASFCGLVLIVFGACGGSGNSKVDAPTAKATYVPQRSVPPPATIGAADGVSWCVRNVCSVATNLPPTATATPVPTPVSLPGEDCSPLDIETVETGIYVLDLTTCELGRFNSARYDAGVTWSPDGSKLAFVRTYGPSFENGSDVFVLDLQSGTETRVTFTPDEREVLLRWSPDGKALAFQSQPVDALSGAADRSGLRLLLLNDQQERMLDAYATLECLFTWSPDSRTIAVGCTRAQFYLIDVVSGEPRVLDEHYGFGDPAWSPDGGIVAYSCQPDAENDGLRFACVIRRDGTGRKQFAERTDAPIWSLNGESVVFYDGNRLFFGDPASGTYLRIVDGWDGGRPELFLSGRVLVGLFCGPYQGPCIYDIESRKKIDAPQRFFAEWSPNKRYLAFAVSNLPGGL